MKRYEVEKIRNVALIGPGGAGKTSLGEAILYTTGVSSRLGRVDDGSSTLDFEPEEKAHRLTISTSLASIEVDKHKLNLLDTPGYDVFLYDAQSVLQGVDAAVLVVAAEPVVKFEANKLWSYCDDYQLPRAVVINRLDRENATFSGALEALREAFGPSLAALHLPLGAEAGFRGYVDLIRMVAVSFPADGAKGTEGPVPSELAAEAQAARDVLVEHLVETDDQLMEKFFDGQEITLAELTGALRKGVASRQVVPVLAAAATRAIGATALLDFIIQAFPSPQERPPVTGTAPDGSAAVRAPREDGPFAALVFKTVSDPFTGRLNLFRVLSGSLSSDSTVWNATRGVEERVGQLFTLVGKETKTVPVAGLGDILAVAKFKETTTGDTLTDKANPLRLPRAQPPEPLMTFAVYPKARGDEEKMGQGLRRMQDEDSTVRLSREEQTHELLVSGMGRLHMDILCERMKRKYGADVELRLPKVPYRETIKGTTKVQGRHKKQSGGRGQFGDTWIEIRPLPRGEGFRFVDKIVGGAIPRQYIPAVEDGIREATTHGILAGYPVVDLEVTLFDGKYHDVDSSEMAFKIAGSLGFKKGAVECRPVLLEPIMELAVRVPDASMGDIIGDLNSRRGRVLGMDPEAGTQVIRAHVPLSEVLEYAPDLRSMTSGRGTFTMKFDHYDEVPGHLSEKIVAAARAERGDD